MKPELLIPDQKLPVQLSRLLCKGKEVDVAVSFVNERGVAFLHAALVDVLKNRGRVRILVSLEMSISTPGALKRLKSLERYHGFELRCFAQNDGFDMFHGKFIIVRNGGVSAVIIGSSNMTGGGYTSNAELNVLLRDYAVAASTGKYFERLWLDVIDGGYSKLLTDAVLEKYTKQYKAAEHAKKQLRTHTLHLGKYDDSSVAWDKLIADAKKFRKSADYAIAVRERAVAIAEIRKHLDAPKFHRLSAESWKAFFSVKSLGHLIAIRRDQIYREKIKLLKLFGFLAKDRSGIDERWDIAIDKYWVKHVGHNIMSKVLTAIDPIKYGIWNKAMFNGMKKYGFLAGRNMTQGQKYKAICSFQKKICEKSGIANNAVLDSWLHE